MTQQYPLWNSLEIAKLVASLTGPAIILLVGIWVAKLSLINQKVIEKRIQVYDILAPMLNDLYCYFYYVGNWKELTPKQIIELKRCLDKQFYIYSALFSKRFAHLYFKFIHLCFKTYVGSGKDAQMRTHIADQFENRRISLSTNWDDSWDKMFAEWDEATNPEEIKHYYNELMICFANELGYIQK